MDFDWTRWTDTGTETHTITNNRRGYGQEDDDGRDLTKGHYDGAGNNYLQEPENLQYYRYFDGDRAESKRGVIIYNTTTELWEPVIYGYFIRSSVLGGQIVSEADATGKKTHTYVYANGAVLAHQVIKIVIGSPQESVAWEHRDPHNKRVQYASTAGGQPYGIGLESGDVDSLGRMVGTLTYTPPSHDPENTISPFYQAPEPVGTGQCRSVEDAIRNNCSPQSVAQQITKSLGKWVGTNRGTIEGEETSPIEWTWVDPKGDDFIRVDKEFVDSLRPFLKASLKRKSCADFITKYVGGADLLDAFDKVVNEQGGLVIVPMKPGYTYSAFAEGSIERKTGQIQFNFNPSPYPSPSLYLAYRETRMRVAQIIHELIHLVGPDDNEMAKRMYADGLSTVPAPDSKNYPRTQEGAIKWAYDSSAGWKNILNDHCLVDNDEFKEWWLNGVDDD